MTLSRAERLDRIDQVSARLEAEFAGTIRIGLRGREWIFRLLREAEESVEVLLSDTSVSDENFDLEGVLRRSFNTVIERQLADRERSARSATYAALREEVYPPQPRRTGVGLQIGEQVFDRYGRPIGTVMSSEVQYDGYMAPDSRFRINLQLVSGQEEVYDRIYGRREVSERRPPSEFDQASLEERLTQLLFDQIKDEDGVLTPRSPAKPKPKPENPHCGDGFFSIADFFDTDGTVKDDKRDPS